MNTFAKILATACAFGAALEPLSAHATAVKRLELSKVIASIMTPAGRTALSYDDLRKIVFDVSYPDAQDFSAKYRAIWSPHYQGTISLALHAKPYGADPLTQQDLWHVEIDGANEFPSVIQFTPENATTDAGNNAYFTQAGFTLTKTACESLDSGNYTDLYLLAYTGKQSAYLEIAVSTGTAGTFVSYKLFWRAPESSMLPDAMKSQGCFPA